MEDFLLTDGEESFTNSLTAKLYQAESDFNQEINQAVKNGYSAEKVFPAVIDGVSFHQREREDYIIAYLFSQKITDATLRKRVMLALIGGRQGDYSALDSLAIPGVSSKQLSRIQEAEVQTQLSIYETVEKNLLKLHAQLIARYNVLPILPLLQNLSPDDLGRITKELTNYINYITGQKADALFTDTPFPESLENLLLKVSPSLPVFKATSSVEKVRYLTELQALCLAVGETALQGGPENDAAVASASETLALVNAPVNYH
ncbi:MAG: hypothetical protein WEC83_01230 [Patescibacteria group bacterium]